MHPRFHYAGREIGHARNRHLAMVVNEEPATEFRLRSLVWILAGAQLTLPAQKTGSIRRLIPADRFLCEPTDIRIIGDIYI